MALSSTKSKKKKEQLLTFHACDGDTGYIPSG
jgi:hypothetical protein